MIQELDSLLTQVRKSLSEQRAVKQADIRQENVLMSTKAFEQVHILVGLVKWKLPDVFDESLFLVVQALSY